ncbi:MAG: magnesium transporter [Rickettsiaceae bacterium]|nr:magnesium transporter [Rickettsiaceae bacterium]MDP5020390.1 magnesium transporter [Rickettsiaceae bacterium]
MHESQNTISPDHQDILDDQFKHIRYLIHNDKLDDASEALLALHHADLADFLDNANRRIYHVILPSIVDKLHPETLVCLSDGNKQRVIEALGVQKSASLIDQLDIEDSIEVIEVLGDELKQAIIAQLKLEKRQQILEGFKYPENTAGRVLEKDFVPFQQHWTAGQAIDFIRRSQLQSDFHAAIVVSSKFHPVGTILLSTLLKAPRNTRISELMNFEFKSVDTHTELDDLAFIFKQYALTIVPVTNRQGKLVGSISIDNMLYIIEEQTKSEFMHLGGVYNSDIFNNLYATAKHRFPWLFVNLVTACITSMVINQFSDTIAKLITLATIMPIVASMGGNAGTQAMTVTVRALAGREINNSNTMRVVCKEVLVCTLNGLLLAAIGVILIYLLFADIGLSAVFASAVTINFTVAGLLGSAIPIILNRLDIDPAAASGVFLTACTDAIGFFSFLGLAFFFLV